MTSPASRSARRERLVGLLVLGIAAVLVVSSVTWFGSGRTGVGVGQLVLGVVLGLARFYHGISAEDAVNMIVSGFCKVVFKELPMEFAVEAQNLLSVSLEGAVG